MGGGREDISEEHVDGDVFSFGNRMMGWEFIGEMGGIIVG